MLTSRIASGVSYLLTAACCLAACDAWAQSGVAYVGDLESVDRALIESAELPLPGIAAIPTASRPTMPPTPLPTDGVRPVAAHMPVAAPQTAPAKKRPTLFGSLKKPSWLFGGESKSREPATDPFTAAAKPTAPRAVAPIATVPSGPQAVKVAAYQPGSSQPSQRVQPSQQAMSPRGSVRRAGSVSGRSGGIVTRESATPQRGLFSGWFGGDSKKPAPKSKPTTRQQVASRQPMQPAATRIPTTTRSPLAPPTAPPRYARQTPKAPTARSAASEPMGVVMITDAPKLKSKPPPARVAKQTPSPASRSLSSKMAALRAPIASKPISEAPAKKPAIVSAPAAKPALPKATELPPIQPTNPPAAAVVVAAPESEAKPKASAKGPQRIDIAESLAIVEDSEPEPIDAEPAPKPVVRAPAPMVAKVETPLPAAPPVAEPSSSREPVFATDSIIVIDSGEPKPLTVYNDARTEDAPPSDRSRDLLREAHKLAEDAVTESEYAAIIKRCRYVLAIDRSREAIAYANQLAAWALNKRGELHDDAGRYGEAEADFVDAIAADPECWRSEHRLGVQAARRGEFGEARRRFDRSLRIHPEHAKALGNRAAIELAEGDLQAALTDYRRALEIDPDLASAHLGCGRVCHMTERYAEGLRHLDAAEVLTPGDAGVAAARGDLLSDLGRYAQARDAYGRAIALDPQSPTAFRNLAWLLATCPQPEHRDGVAAVANAERAEELLGEADDLTLDTQAAALAAAGHFDEAAAAQRRAIELAPPSDASAYRERLSLYEQGEAFFSRPSGVRQASYGGGAMR